MKGTRSRRTFRNYKRMTFREGSDIEEREPASASTITSTIPSALTDVYTYVCSVSMSLKLGISPAPSFQNNRTNKSDIIEIDRVPAQSRLPTFDDLAEDTTSERPGFVQFVRIPLEGL